MCGIAGVIGRVDREAVVRMLDAQQHRGPDGRQIWSATWGQITMGHDRLSIVDLTTGAQPMSNEDGTLWLVANGEIYNHNELRAELELRHQFRTHSDCEVLLHLFEDEGPEMVRRLVGMFSFALWSEPTGLFIARDPMGIKPIYYGHDSHGNLRFASEIKSLLEDVPVIDELPPGSYMLQGKPPVRYYVVPWPTPEDMGSDIEAIDLLDVALSRAVKRRLMADVPIGCFLSGGLDSSLIAGIMRRLVSGEMHTFSVGVEGSADLLSARKVAEQLGTLHHERVLTPSEVTSLLPVVIDQLESCDPALVRSSVPTYYVSELAAQYVKVVLSGEGADELFAGYHYLDELGDDLPTELRRITCSLHNSNLQRVDRMTMAHGLEARVPFLDTQVVDLAFRMDTELKRRGGDSKWVIRKVAERYLDPEIVWRRKEKFATGTGIGTILEAHADQSTSADERSGLGAEEYLYWQYYRIRYGREDVLAAMGRSRSLNEVQRWTSAV